MPELSGSRLIVSRAPASFPLLPHSLGVETNGRARGLENWRCQLETVSEPFLEICRPSPSSGLGGSSFMLCDGPIQRLKYLAVGRPAVTWKQLPINHSTNIRCTNPLVNFPNGSCVKLDLLITMRCSLRRLRKATDSSRFWVAGIAVGLMVRADPFGRSALRGTWTHWRVPALSRAASA
eukprot:7567463-Pyramimonas_sp.AAC.1